MPQLRLGIAQTNVVVGDLEGNAVLLAEGIAQARAAGCALVAFPELALTGYPPEDLLLKPRFVERNLSRAPRPGDASGVDQEISDCDEP